MNEVLISHTYLCPKHGHFSYAAHPSEKVLCQLCKGEVQRIEKKEASQ